jgi:2-phospho-L-lactate/phosphoenolpyruvate guanylyltransferase
MDIPTHTPPHTWAVIPVKPFAQGKSRLAALLGAERRAALNRHLFGRVLGAVLGRFRHDRVMVVTTDTVLLTLMRGLGVHALQETGDGLNAALALACRFAAERGARAIAVLPSDLPTVGTDDVAALLAALPNAPACVIAPDDQEEGTNALALTPPTADFFRFGAESFQAHLGEARVRGLALRILRRPGLAYDLDTPDDYRQFAKQQLTGATA